MALMRLLSMLTQLGRLLITLLPTLICPMLMGRVLAPGRPAMPVGKELIGLPGSVLGRLLPGRLLPGRLLPGKFEPGRT